MYRINITRSGRFNDMAQEGERSVETREGSAVILVNGTLRQCHILSLLPLSSTATDEHGQEIRTISSYRVYLEAASYLAMKHFNDRDPTVLPGLPDLLQDCDVQLTVDLRDTQFSPIEAARNLQDAQNSHKLSGTPLPTALFGDARSTVSQTIAILAGSYELPQISGSSTSASLDNKDTYPFFARTVPTNEGDAKALLIYLESLKVTHFGVIYIGDSYGTAYNGFIAKEAYLRGITVVSAQFKDDKGNDSISNATERIRKSGVRYIFGICNPPSWKTVARSAIDAGILGQFGYTWLLSDTSLALAQPGFTLNRETERDLARAMHGTGVLSPTTPTYLKFEEALATFQNNTDLQQVFVSKHRDAPIFDGFDWTYPGRSIYQYLYYDAAISLGLAACRADNKFFTGPELYRTLVALEFEGVSGHVSFKNISGTRNADDLSYNIQNLLLSDAFSAQDNYSFTGNVAVNIDFRSAHIITEILPFVYADNSTIPPQALPPFDENLNLITTPVRVVGLVLCAATILCSLGWCAWTWKNRKADIVRASQPIFLGQLCIGTIIFGASIIPMSMQEPISQHGLDIACMSTLWLLSIGFVTSFAALFSKTMRLNRLFKHGQGFRRTQVKARDVLLPFVVMMTINIALLVVLTTVAPLTYSRVQVQNFDSFGRSIESYGVCFKQEGNMEKAVQTSVIVALFVVNLAALLFANYQCFLARNLPSDFNESFYVTLTNAGILEALILGSPMLFLVYDNPTANFLVRSLLVAIICFTILLPTFIPKALQRAVRKLRKEHNFSTRRITVAQHRSKNDSQQADGQNTVEEHETRAGTSKVMRNDDFWVHRQSSMSFRENGHELNRASLSYREAKGLKSQRMSNQSRLGSCASQLEVPLEDSANKLES